MATAVVVRSLARQRRAQRVPRPYGTRRAQPRRFASFVEGQLVESSARRGDDRRDGCCRLVASSHGFEGEQSRKERAGSAVEQSEWESAGEQESQQEKGDLLVRRRRGRRLRQNKGQTDTFFPVQVVASFVLDMTAVLNVRSLFSRNLRNEGMKEKYV